MTYYVVNEPKQELYFPIGEIIRSEKGTFIVKESDENKPCDGCAFDIPNGVCPHWFCSQEDRADDKDVFFELTKSN